MMGLNKNIIKSDKYNVIAFEANALVEMRKDWKGKADEHSISSDLEDIQARV
jgi:hypothetical protein